MFSLLQHAMCDTVSFQLLCYHSQSQSAEAAVLSAFQKYHLSRLDQAMVHFLDTQGFLSIVHCACVGI